MAFFMGELAGVFLACAGVGYVLIGLLAITGAKKRWPRATCRGAAGVCLVLAVVTALPQTTAIRVIGYVLAGVAAAAFILWRGSKTKDTKAPAPGLPAAVE